MSRVALVLLLALAVFAVAWGFSRVAPPAPEAPASRRAPARAGGEAMVHELAPPATGAAGGPALSGATGSPAPLRDLFAYAGERAPSSAPAAGDAPVLVPTTAPQPTPTPRPVSLVGFVRQAGVLRAALRVHGDVVLAAPGERVGDYAVLALDEDAGVRLRGPDGAELTLSPER
jgi:hypothetical protein